METIVTFQKKKNSRMFIQVRIQINGSMLFKIGNLKVKFEGRKEKTNTYLQSTKLIVSIGFLKK